jgi:hypothetical protein
MPTKRECAVTWWNSAAQMCLLLDSSHFVPILVLPRSLLLAFLLFALVAALSQCLCSQSPYLSIKLYSIYVCYMNITLCIAFSIIRSLM